MTRSDHTARFQPGTRVAQIGRPSAGQTSLRGVVLAYSPKLDLVRWLPDGGERELIDVATSLRPTAGKRRAPTHQERRAADPRLVSCPVCGWRCRPTQRGALRFHDRPDRSTFCPGSGLLPTAKVDGRGAGGGPVASVGV